MLIYGPLGITEQKYCHVIQVDIRHVMDDRLKYFLTTCHGACLYEFEVKYDENADLPWHHYMELHLIDAEDAVQYRLMMD